MPNVLPTGLSTINNCQMHHVTFPWQPQQQVRQDSNKHVLRKCEAVRHPVVSIKKKISIADRFREPQKDNSVPSEYMVFESHVPMHTHAYIFSICNVTASQYIIMVAKVKLDRGIWLPW